jgi:hypothetical protein
MSDSFSRIIVQRYEEKVESGKRKAEKIAAAMHFFLTLNS